MVRLADKKEIAFNFLYEKRGFKISKNSFLAPKEKYILKKKADKYL